ncbi:hypothetical protein AAMO2058_000239900 [Amorphochlora amoebiformis]
MSSLDEKIQPGEELDAKEKLDAKQELQPDRKMHKPSPSERKEGVGSGGGDDESDVEIDPDHHLMDRVQKALFQQLSERKLELEERIRDKKEALARIIKRREQTGVELYGFQQQLAKMQQDLESKHDLQMQIQEERESSEKRAKFLSQVLADTQKERDQTQKKRFDEQKSLDDLRMTVQQVEEHNKEIKGEIQVARRAAIGTEENMKKAEKQKRSQDYLINELNQQIKALTEQTRLYEVQVKSQSKQTKIARETLMEAEKEIENINVEKREFLHRWKTSLVGMNRRDETLQKEQNSLAKHKEEMQVLSMEIMGIKKSIEEVQGENEMLTGIKSKLETEHNFLETLNEQSEQDLLAKQGKFHMVQTSLSTLEDQLKKETLKTKDLKGRVDILQKELEKFDQERQKIDNRIDQEIKGNIDTLKRGKQNVAKEVLKLRKLIREKEQVVSATRNELARFRVDVLNTKASHTSLKESLEEYDKEMQEKDKIITEYEAELKKGEITLERKTIYIARLNKKYDQLTANQDEENTGPLEAVIRTLKKDINKLKLNTQALQRRWIGLQNKLVNTVQATEQIAKKVREQRSCISVLEQKILRLRNELEQETAEGNELAALMRRLRMEAVKLNKLIAESEVFSKELASNNYNMKNQFANELKGMEKTSQTREERIKQLNEEKEEAIKNVLECEKKIMLLERKIQLERETHAALDPEFGQPEIKGMKKEIHRMELRLIQLKKQQEIMIQHMERTIAKRQMIQKGHEACRNKGDSRLKLRKKIQSLKSALKKNMKEFKTVEVSVKKEEELSKAIFADVEVIRRKLSQVEDDKLSLDNKVQLSRLKKRINSGRIILLERKSRRTQALIRKRKISQADLDLGAMGFIKETEVRQKIGDVIRSLRENYPKLSHCMNALEEFLNE